ncbi:hypothetical protein AD998_07305 [bacterium 336/3]|nr:hypothetical protein AD998_07305 [bacterium 336/3]
MAENTKYTEDAFSKVNVFFDMFEDVLHKQNQQIEQRITQEIRNIKEALSQEEIKIQEKLNPVLEEKVERVKEELSKINNISIIIKKEIRESQPEMIDALYPIMGKLVQKFIKVELEKLNENINKQLDNSFSWEAIRRELLGLLGIKQEDILLAQASQATINEFFVIYQNSGILHAHYSKEDVIDDDMVAGMLTAIKSFINDAFRNSADLETIEYGNSKILIFSAVRFYLVAVVSGVVDKGFQERLQSYMQLFYETHLSNATDEEITEKDLNKILKKHIEDFPNYNLIAQKINDYRQNIKQKGNFNWKFWRW